MEQTRRNYLAWLRDAHAMEGQALAMMQGMVGRLESYPQVRDRIESHIEETRDQLEALGRLLDRRGAGSSLVKDPIGKLAAFAQTVSGAPADDDVIKGLLASYTFESLEIALYRILITASKQMGDAEAVAVFARSPDQEEAMAAWLAGRTAEITRTFLSRAEVRVPAQG